MPKSRVRKSRRRSAKDESVEEKRGRMFFKIHYDHLVEAHGIEKARSLMLDEFANNDPEYLSLFMEMTEKVGDPAKARRVFEIMLPFWVTGDDPDFDSEDSSARAELLGVLGPELLVEFAKASSL